MSREAPPSTPRHHCHLITGATGFVGCHLAHLLLERGEGLVVGLARQPGGYWPRPWRERLGPHIPLHVADVCDGPAVEAVLREVAPTRIYHLAGYARVGESFREAEAAWQGNLGATRSLCEAIIRWGQQPRVLYVGSGLVYGTPIDPDRPFDEDSPLRPETPYAASKAAADLVCYQYSRAPYHLDIVRARPFNHTGPYQSADFAVPNFARQLVAIERRQSPPVLETGDLTPHRDLCDVRDVVMAYVSLMDRAEEDGGGDVYNIASGQSVSMRAVLDRMLTLMDLSSVVELRRRADLLRPTTTTTTEEKAVAIRVDVSKLKCKTGWSPRYTLEETLQDTLNAWRQQEQVE